MKANFEIDGKRIDIDISLNKKFELFDKRKLAKYIGEMIYNTLTIPDDAYEDIEGTGYFNFSFEQIKRVDDKTTYILFDYNEMEIIETVKMSYDTAKTIFTDIIQKNFNELVDYHILDIKNKKVIPIKIEVEQILKIKIL